MVRSQQITRLENQRDAPSGLKLLEELKEEEEEEHVRIVTVVFFNVLYLNSKLTNEKMWFWDVRVPSV